jgi:hypothetical protein
VGMMEIFQRSEHCNLNYNNGDNHNDNCAEGINATYQAFDIPAGNSNKILTNKDIIDYESKTNSQNDKDDSFEDKIEINLENVFIKQNYSGSEKMTNNKINNSNINTTEIIEHINDKSLKNPEDFKTDKNYESSITTGTNKIFGNDNISSANTNTNTSNSFSAIVNSFFQNVIKDNFYPSTRDTDFNTKQLSWELIKNFIPNSNQPKNLELLNDLKTNNFHNENYPQEDSDYLKTNLIDFEMLKKLNELNNEEVKLKSYLDSVINDPEYFRMNNIDNNNDNYNNFSKNSDQNRLTNELNNHLFNYLSDANLNFTNENIRLNFHNNLLNNYQNTNLINSLINYNQNLDTLNCNNNTNQTSNNPNIPVNFCNYNSDDISAKLQIEQTQNCSDIDNNNKTAFCSNDISNAIQNRNIVKTLHNLNFLNTNVNNANNFENNYLRNKFDLQENNKVNGNPSKSLLQSLSAINSDIHSNNLEDNIKIGRL